MEFSHLQPFSNLDCKLNCWNSKRDGSSKAGGWGPDIRIASQPNAQAKKSQKWTRTLKMMTGFRPRWVRSIRNSTGKCMCSLISNSPKKDGTVCDKPPCLFPLSCWLRSLLAFLLSCTCTPWGMTGQPHKARWEFWVASDSRWTS